MSHHHDVDREPNSGGSFLTSRSGLVLIVFLAIAGFFLFTEHRAHLLGILPFLLLLLCPLLHMFHGGHDGRDGHAGHDAGPPAQR
jgi:hypothetical protein